MKAYISVLKNKYTASLLIWVSLVSFFLWMEYKAYQIRSTMSEAISGINSAFNNFWKTVSYWEKKEVKDVEIQKWAAHLTDKGIQISVKSAENIGKKFSQNIYEEKIAKNTFYKIVIQGENVSKEPSFQSLRWVSIILSDGTRYNWETVQIDTKYRPDWYSGCISCDMNPGDKSVEAALFDINATSIEWAKMKIGNLVFDL